MSLRTARALERAQAVVDRLIRPQTANDPATGVVLDNACCRELAAAGAAAGVTWFALDLRESIVRRAPRVTKDQAAALFWVLDEITRLEGKL